MRGKIIAVDIGTTNMKALMFDPDGTILASRSISYALHTPNPDTAEQDPEEIFAAVLTGISELMKLSGISPEELLCIAFSSAMHSLMAMDEHHRPLTRSMTWADQRGREVAEKLNRTELGLSIYRSTGTPIHPMSPLVKLMWMKEHQSGIFASAGKFIGIKEYVCFRLFGRYIVDHSIASATGLFNLNSLSWDKQALQTAGIREDQLSEPVPTTYRLTGLMPEYASRLGIHPDTPFIIGASDGVLANLGSGVMSTERMSVTIGTSGAVRTVVGKPAFDAGGRLFCYALAEDFWVVGGPSNNGGLVLQWLAEQVFREKAELHKSQIGELYEKMLKLAEEIPPGSEGLLFLPYLTGERAPIWDANAKGVYFGLSLRHEKKHMLRSAMEGVIFQIAAIASLLEGISDRPKEIIASGGFARSALWCQILADVQGIPVVVPETVESSGWGAAILGMYAMGVKETLVDPVAPDLHRGAEKVTRFAPIAANHSLYRRLLPIYQQVGRQLTDSFQEITRFQSETQA
ncbi:gluconokinase [Ferviditalea candida]|uniref:FGGY family carbohydrate kinase n=1 Tax=Ferviditalea candida TaxID=3108399 RepID=A0ABU5ZMR0_9BACL|nr:FGGY family carbohydrate kinase [Paenibacillaceae bacterium T2]